MTSVFSVSLKASSGNDAPVSSLLRLTPSTVAIGGNKSVRFLDVTAQVLLNESLSGGTIDGTVDKMCLLPDGTFLVGASSGQLTNWTWTPALEKVEAQIIGNPFFSPPGCFSAIIVAGTDLFVACGDGQLSKCTLSEMKVRCRARRSDAKSVVNVPVVGVSSRSSFASVPHDV